MVDMFENYPTSVESKLLKFVLGTYRNIDNFGGLLKNRYKHKL